MGLSFAARPLDYVTEADFSIFRCNQCGHGVTAIDRKAHEAVLPKLYESGNYDNSEAKEGWLRARIGSVIGFLERERIRFLRRWITQGRVFEIGVGKGRFLASVARAGFMVSGIEPSARSYQHASRRLGERVTKQTLEEHVQNSAGRYDLVYMWHVLEHFSDPDSAVQNVQKILAPGGLLVVAVPNFGSLQARYGGRFWYHLDPPRHLHHFTAVSLTQLFQRNGYEVVKVSYSSFYQNWLGEVITLMNRLSPYKNVLINVTKSRKVFLNRVGLVRGVAATVWNCVLLLVFTPASIAVTVVNEIRGNSGTMVFVGKSKA